MFGSRKRRSRTARRWITWLVLSCLLSGGRAQAQREDWTGPRSDVGQWAIMDAVGYGGAGFLVGIAAAWESESFATIGAFTVAGVVAGTVIGRHVSQQAAAGAAPGAASRFFASTGALLAGTTLGAMVAVPLISNEGSRTPLGSDETTAAVLMTAGTALGGVFLVQHNKDFSRTRVAFAPIRTRESAYGLRVAVRY